MKNKKVIVLDVDDTLYPEREYARSGLRAASRFAADAWGLHGLSEVAQSLFDEGCRGDIFQKSLRAIGHPSPHDRMVTALVQAYREHEPLLSFFPDVAEVLPKLKRYGRLAILTDGYLPPQRNKVAALGLDFIDPIVYTESLGRTCWKPSPEGFMHIEARCGASPDDCFYIADNPTKDFIAPRQRGWTTIRIRRPETEHYHNDRGTPADIELQDFFQLERWLSVNAARLLLL